VVAAEEALPHRLAEPVFDRPALLDREVRDAPARVEDERPGERFGRARVEAARARAASLLDRRVGREDERRHDLAEDEERSLPGDDEQSIFADEAETRARGPRALEDRRVVDERTRLGAERADERRQAPQLLAHAVVVVAAARVAGDPPRQASDLR